MTAAVCSTCGNPPTAPARQRIVATRWPSGYPHATPCPECRPGERCDCGLTPGTCPSAEAIKKWNDRPRCGFSLGAGAGSR